MSALWKHTRWEDTSLPDFDRPVVYDHNGLLRPVKTGNSDDPWELVRGMLDHDPDFLSTCGPRVYLAALWRCALWILLRSNMPGVQEWALTLLWLANNRRQTVTSNRLASTYHAACVALRPRMTKTVHQWDYLFARWNGDFNGNQYSRPYQESFPSYLTTYVCRKMIEHGALHKPKPTEWAEIRERFPCFLPFIGMTMSLDSMPTKEVSSPRQTRERQLVIGWSFALMRSSLREFHHALSQAVRDYESEARVHAAQIPRLYSGFRTQLGTVAFGTGKDVVETLDEFDSVLAAALLKNCGMESQSLGEWLETDNLGPLSAAPVRQPSHAVAAVDLNDAAITYVPRIPLPVNLAENW